jgi:hypothetical protein
LIRVAQGTGAGQDVGVQVQRVLQERLPGQTRTPPGGSCRGPGEYGLAAPGSVCAVVCHFGDGSLYFRPVWSQVVQALGLAAVLFVVTYAIPLEFLGLSPRVLIAGSSHLSS